MESVGHLQVEPELRRGAEGRLQLPGRPRRDLLMAIDDRVDRLGGTTQDLGQVALRPATGFQLLPDESPGGKYFSDRTVAPGHGVSPQVLSDSLRSPGQ